MRAYLNTQKPTTISIIIHHSMLAYKIFYNSSKLVAKPSEKDRKLMQKPYNSLKASDIKKKYKGTYKGINKLSFEELLKCQKDNKCFCFGEQGHT